MKRIGIVGECCVCDDLIVSTLLLRYPSVICLIVSIGCRQIDPSPFLFIKGFEGSLLDHHTGEETDILISLPQKTGDLISNDDGFVFQVGLGLGIKRFDTLTESSICCLFDGVLAALDDVGRTAFEKGIDLFKTHNRDPRQKKQRNHFEEDKNDNELGFDRKILKHKLIILFFS